MILASEILAAICSKHVNWLQHSDWDPNTWGMPNDFCLMEFKRSHRPQQPVRRRRSSGSRNSQLPRDVLKEHKVPVLTNEVCVEKYDWFNLIHPLQDVHVGMGDPDVEDVHDCHVSYSFAQRRRIPANFPNFPELLWYDYFSWFMLQ